MLGNLGNRAVCHAHKHGMANHYAATGAAGMHTAVGSNTHLQRARRHRVWPEYLSRGLHSGARIVGSGQRPLDERKELD